MQRRGISNRAHVSKATSGKANVGEARERKAVDVASMTNGEGSLAIWRSQGVPPW